MRIGLIVPGGVDRSARVRVIPVLLALIERLAKRHKVLVIAINQEPQACDYDLFGAHIVNLGARQESGSLSWSIRLVQLLSTLKSFGGTFDVLHAFWAHPTGSLAVAAGAITGAPVVVSIGGGEMVWLPEIGYGGRGALQSRMAISAALKMATVVSAPSEYALQAVRRVRKDTLWLPLGVTNTFFQAKNVGNPTNKEKRLLHVASLNHVKDQITLLKAIRKVYDVFPNVRLDCVGVDTLNGKIQHLAESLGIADAVRFHGALPVDELLPFYRDADLYVQSSLHESMGAAVLEASAAGVPVIGTNVGLVAEMAPQAAVAVPPSDVEALARGILELLTCEERRIRIGDAAQKFARTYDADWSASTLESIYRRLGSRAMSSAYDMTQSDVNHPKIPAK